jgi:hypothetical protein
MGRGIPAAPTAASAALILMFASAMASAQPGAGPDSGGAGPASRGAERGGGRGGPPPSARASAQVDLTGYWVALVTEDWLWRMITPPRGDATSVPLNAQGRRVAAEWDRGKDEADGEACRPFGAAGLMRMPLRLHISWQDDNTLKIETDAGQQTRLLHFGGTAPAPSAPSWQGVTSAEWTAPAPGGFDLKALVSGRPPAAPTGPPMGSVKAVTTNLRAGYLRKNGLPYSENAKLTEYFSRVSAFGNDYLTVLSIVHDPMNLSTDFITSSQFKHEPDGGHWNPSPCRTAPPLAGQTPPQPAAETARPPAASGD